MEITEIRVIRKEDPTKKLRAFVNVTFDGCFVVRDMKVVEGSKGLFVAMPSRKLKMSCPKCHYKSAVGNRYCAHCGGQMPANRDFHKEGKDSGHKDIAHPITLEFREKLQKAILAAYEKEAKEGPPKQEPAPPPSPKDSEDRPSMSLRDEDY